MFTLLGILIAASALIGAVLFYNKKQKDAGRAEQKLEQSEELQDALIKDKIAIDKLNADPAERKRVRDKFTRK